MYPVHPLYCFLFAFTIALDEFIICNHLHISVDQFLFTPPLVCTTRASQLESESFDRSFATPFLRAAPEPPHHIPSYSHPSVILPSHQHPHSSSSHSYHEPLIAPRSRSPRTSALLSLRDSRLRQTSSGTREVIIRVTRRDRITIESQYLSRSTYHHRDKPKSPSFNVQKLHFVTRDIRTP